MTGVLLLAFWFWVIWEVTGAIGRAMAAVIMACLRRRR
jgi:hypothetical protein